MFQKLAPRRVWNELRKNKRVLLIDLALFVTVILLFATDEKTLLLHLVFVLLIYGAFFWSLLAFFYRVGLWVPVATIAVLTAVFQDQISNDLLIQIPMMAFILIMVFGIVRRRSFAEKALRASEKQYKRLVELAFESIIIVVEDKFVFSNTQAVSLFDAKNSEDLIGESLGKYLHPASFEGFKVWTKRFMNKKGELPLFEEQFVRPDNTFVDVEVAGLGITYQDQPALLLVIRDITARKQTSKALMESHIRFQNLLESAPDAVIVFDEDGIITLVNARAEAIFFYDRKELLGNSVEQLIPGQSKKLHRQQRNNYLANLRLHSVNDYSGLSGRRKDGTEFPIDLKLSHFFIEDGLRITCVIRDITERKQAEAEVIRSARLAALGQMSTALAHELNNPLQIIQGYLDIMLDFPTQWNEIYDYLQIIRQQINRMHEEAKSILDYARPMQKPRQPVDFAGVIRQVLSLAEKQLQQTNMQVDLDLRDVPPVLAAPDPLVQVVLNLIINAIESSNQSNKLLQIALRAQQAKVIMSFTTYGQIIPEEDLPHIFDPFFTTKPGGSGLGLWISLNLVEQNQGTLTAENRADGLGVVFKITLPIAPEFIGAPS